MTDKTVETTVRRRIYSHLTRTRFLHVEDALDGIAKLRLFAGQYQRGKGASAMTSHYVDLDDGRALFFDLSRGNDIQYVEYKGSVYDEGPVSRVLKVNSGEDGKVWFQLTRGPGELAAQGAVQPAGEPKVDVSVPLKPEAARKLGFAVLAYVTAWEGRYLVDQTAVVPQAMVYADGTEIDGDNRTEREAFRVYVSVHREVPPSRDTLREWWREKGE